jgi:glutathione synthase/RimK-type ligase-like ATP-grasp enzyme
MKKIAILHGRERTFPEAFIQRVNELAPKGVTAVSAHVNQVAQGEPTEYAVLIDRISQDVPFYRAYLKNAALNGTAVINNPFWWSADEKFFNNCLATKLGVAVPRTVILPSKDLPADCTGESFSNLAYPLDWEGIFKYIGWPAYFKPHSGGGWKNVYKVRNPDEFFKAYAETGQLVMLLQSEVTFDDYFRCYCIGGKDVKIMRYEPRNPHHLRYVVDRPAPSKQLLERVEQDTLKLNHALGYDFNTVEFAVSSDGVPYAIDFCNPAPDADRKSVGDENFAWVVNAAARLALRKVEEHQAGKNNLTWGKFVKEFAK